MAEGNDGPSIEPATFWGRLMKVHEAWRRGGKPWGGEPPVDALVIAHGTHDADVLYSRTLSLHLWLFGYELPETVLVLFEKSVLIVTGKTKVDLLQVLNKEPHELSLELVVKEKKDNFEGNFEKILKDLREHNCKRVGYLTKVQEAGPFMDGFLPKLKSAAELVDVAAALALMMQVKEQRELKCVRKAAEHAHNVLKRFLLPEMEGIVDEEKSVKHSDLALSTDKAITDPNKQKQIKTADLDIADVESAYTPVVMSGQYFDLKPGALSNDEPMAQEGAILLAIGTRYKSYCANIARTYFVNPTDDQQEAYKVLEAVWAACKGAMKKDKRAADVYEAAVSVIQSKKPDLLPHFTENCGFGMGIEFRDGTLLINKDNVRPLRPAMVINLAVGFKDLPLSGGSGTYAMMIADTVIISDGDEPEILTHMARSFKEITYTIEDEDDDDDAEEAAPAAPLVTKESLRSKVAEKIDSKEAERRENQRLLAQRKHEEALRRLEGDEGESKEEVADGASEMIESYSSPMAFPSKARYDQIFVDGKSESILVPINGRLVPFHINTIKNVHTTDQGQYTHLRINFVTPEVAFNAKNSALPAIADQSQMFVQELTFRSKSQNLNQVFFGIKELRKRVATRMKEHEEQKSLVVQEDLILARKGDPVPRLKDVSVRPVMSRGKVSGTVEAHFNGLRFTPLKGNESVVIIYKNIRHAFFSPARKDTLNVLIHFQLKNEILVGKKKTDYIQFYFDVVDASQDLENRARVGDEDGLIEEQQERKLRHMWNEKFKDFVRSTEDTVKRNVKNLDLEFDIPFTDLMFSGVPSREVVPIMPTVHCLVALDDNPPLCISLDDVEIASFERVQFGLRNFDLIFVFKDFNRAPQNIDSIPVKYLETIKEWLNSVNIVYYESKMNLVWKNIMTTIREDPKVFYEDGGWNFLADEDAAAGAEGDEDDEEQEEESEYEPESEAEEEEDDEEYESEESSSEEEESEPEDDLSEEGEDWDELERKAAAEDKAKAAKDREKGHLDERPAKKRKKGRADSDDDD